MNAARFQRIAHFHDLFDLPFELFRRKQLRSATFERLSGRLLDVSVGTGRNIGFHPEGSEALGIDLNLAMLTPARRVGQ